jgi:hypothetical protein
MSQFFDDFQWGLYNTTAEKTPPNKKESEMEARTEPAIY